MRKIDKWLYKHQKKIRFKGKNIIRHRVGHYIMIKGQFTMKTKLFQYICSKKQSYNNFEAKTDKSQMKNKKIHNFTWRL